MLLQVIVVVVVVVASDWDVYDGNMCQGDAQTGVRRG